MTPPTLLIVDDDPDFLEITARALHRENVNAELIYARDGSEALEILARLNGTPDSPCDRIAAVFLDLNLPGIKGWDVLSRIRSEPKTRDLPVVIVSSSDRVEDVRRSYALGANSYIVKQFRSSGAGRFFAQAARYWTELNRCPSGNDV